MAQERRVSFVPQGVRWREPGDDGDGRLVERPQSVFTRLGPKVSVDVVCDPPYVPESVGEPALPGMIFGCSPATYDECISRQLFGLPMWSKPQVMRIAPGAGIFLFNYHTRFMHGIFEATSHGGVHIVRDAFGGKYEAQVKVRLAENCPFLHESDFKDAIRENYRDAHKFNFHLSEAQVCRLKLLFRLKAAEDSALSIGQNHGCRVVQFCPAGPQLTRNSTQIGSRYLQHKTEGVHFEGAFGNINVPSVDKAYQCRRPCPEILVFDFDHSAAASLSEVNEGDKVQRRVISSVSKDEVEVSRTLLISVPPVLSRVHVSPSHTRRRSLGGLEVSICSKEKKDKKRNGVSDSPTRHVVMYGTRKEQSISPILISKIPRPARQEVVKVVFQSPPSRGISQDRKRRADISPHAVQNYSKGQLLLREKGQEIAEGGSGKHYGDLREVLNLPRKFKKLRPSTKELFKKVVSQPMASPVYTGGNIAIGDVLFIDDSKRNLERVLPLPRKKHSILTSGSLKAESSKDLVISRTSGKADSTEEARKNGKTVRLFQDAQRKLKTASVPADSAVQFLTTSGSYCAKANNVEGRGVTETCRSENGYNNDDRELKTANGDGVGSCVDLSTKLPVKSGVLRNLDDEIMESGPGDQPKDGSLDIYVSLTVEKAENVRQSNSPIMSENHNAVGHVVSCVLGKRTRGSKQDDTVLDSAIELQSLHAGTPVKPRIEVSKKNHPEDSISKVLLTAANISEILQEKEKCNYLPAVPLAEDQYLTSQVLARNASPCMENLSKEDMRVDHVQSIPINILPLNGVIPVVIPNNTSDMISLDCKRHRAVKEIGPSSSLHKLNKIGHNEAGCSYISPEVSTPTEGSDLQEKVFHNYEMPPQSVSHSLFSGKSENLWNSRTLRYGKPRSSNTLANHGSRVSKSGSEPTSALGKSDPNTGSIKLGEESVYSGGEKYDRQPESPNATEASRTSGKLEKQGALLVCELGNSGGLSLDSNMIRVNTEGDILRKHQPSAVASVVEQSMLTTEIGSPSRPDRFQTINTALIPRSDGLESSEFRKIIANMKGLAARESEAADEICYPDDLPSMESVQSTNVASNEGRAHPSLLLRKEPMPLKMERIPLNLELMPFETEPMPNRADAPEDARDLVEDWLYARNRGSPSACTSTASLSDCFGPMGEPELEINIPIKEEELEICLPIEEDEEVHAVPKRQTRRLWGSSNTDIRPWKLLQKNSWHNT